MLLVKWISLTAAAAFFLCAGLSFLLPPPPNPVSPSDQSIEARIHPPAEVMSTLKRACYDCHSNSTHWPIYSRVWPASALMYSDVSKGRATMNFSDWPVSARSKGLLMAACAAMQAGIMPRKQYLLLHPGAKVSPEESQRFCAWTASTLKAPMGHTPLE